MSGTQNMESLSGHALCPLYYRFLKHNVIKTKRRGADDRQCRDVRIKLDSPFNTTFLSRILHAQQLCAGSCRFLCGQQTATSSRPRLHTGHWLFPGCHSCSAKQTVRMLPMPRPATAYRAVRSRSVTAAPDGHQYPHAAEGRQGKSQPGKNRHRQVLGIASD